MKINIYEQDLEGAEFALVQKGDRIGLRLSLAGAHELPTPAIVLWGNPQQLAELLFVGASVAAAAAPVLQADIEAAKASIIAAADELRTNQAADLLPPVEVEGRKLSPSAKAGKHAREAQGARDETAEADYQQRQEAKKKRAEEAERKRAEKQAEAGAGEEE